MFDRASCDDNADDVMMPMTSHDNVVKPKNTVQNRGPFPVRRLKRKKGIAVQFRVASERPRRGAGGEDLSKLGSALQASGRMTWMAGVSEAIAGRRPDFTTCDVGGGWDCLECA